MNIPLDVNQVFQISIQLTQSGLTFINGIFIDNSDNTTGFTLFNPVTRQKIFVPANSQASLALVTQSGTDNIEFIASSTGGVVVPVIFRNTEPISDVIYSTIAAGTIVGAITVQGQVTALPYISGGVDAAVQSITAGGVAQSLFAANAARKGLMIANPASGAQQNLGVAAPESLLIRFGANPSIGGNGTIEIAPGGYFYTPPGMSDTRAVNIMAATDNHVFAAIQYQ